MTTIPYCDLHVWNAGSSRLPFRLRSAWLVGVKTMRTVELEEGESPIGEKRRLFVLRHRVFLGGDLLRSSSVRFGVYFTKAKLSDSRVNLADQFPVQRKADDLLEQDLFQLSRRSGRLYVKNESSAPLKITDLSTAESIPEQFRIVRPGSVTLMPQREWKVAPDTFSLYLEHPGEHGVFHLISMSTPEFHRTIEIDGYADELLRDLVKRRGSMLSESEFESIFGKIQEDAEKKYEQLPIARRIIPR